MKLMGPDGKVITCDGITLTHLQFMRRFTAEERIGIRNAAKVSVELEDFLELLNAAQEVVLTDQLLAGGLSSLVAAGLLTEERKTEILTPYPVGSLPH